MNKFLTFFAFVLLFSTASMAQQTVVSFKAMGHDDEAIFGMSGSTSYFLKIDPKYEVNGSKLVLFFQPSQALIKDHSFVNVLVADQPVFSMRLGTDSIQKIVLNLTRAQVSPGNFVKVQVRTLLTVSDDKCKDLDNPAMWIKGLKSSDLLLNRSDKNFVNDG